MEGLGAESSSSSLRGCRVQAWSGDTGAEAAVTRRRPVDELILRRCPRDGLAGPECGLGGCDGGDTGGTTGAEVGRARGSRRNGRTRRIDIRSQWSGGAAGEDGLGVNSPRQVEARALQGLPKLLLRRLRLPGDALADLQHTDHWSPRY